MDSCLYVLGAPWRHRAKDAFWVTLLCHLSVALSNSNFIHYKNKQAKESKSNPLRETLSSPLLVSHQLNWALAASHTVAEQRTFQSISGLLWLRNRTTSPSSESFPRAMIALPDIWNTIINSEILNKIWGLSSVTVSPFSFLGWSLKFLLHKIFKKEESPQGHSVIFLIWVWKSCLQS